MLKLNKIAALVPMRHSSERVPGKNYRELAGKPLYAHILDTLLAVEEVYLRNGGEFLLGFLGERLVAMGGFKRLSPNLGEVRRMRIARELQGRGCLLLGLLLRLGRRRRAFGRGRPSRLVFVVRHEHAAHAARRGLRRAGLLGTALRGELARDAVVRDVVAAQAQSRQHALIGWLAAKIV